MNMIKGKAIFLFVLLLLFSCDNSTSNSKVEHGFEYDGKKFDLHYGVIDYCGSNAPIDSYRIRTLLSTGSRDLYLDTNYIFLDLNFPEDTVDTGNFTWNSKRVKNSITGAQVRIHENGYEVGGLYVTDGNVSIVRHGSVYEITFKLTINDSRVLKGHFLGALRTVPSFSI